MLVTERNGMTIPKKKKLPRLNIMF